MVHYNEEERLFLLPDARSGAFKSLEYRSAAPLYTDGAVFQAWYRVDQGVYILALSSADYEMTHILHRTTQKH